MSVSIKPLEDRILVQPLDAEQTTASGLVIPDTAKEKPQEGKVLAVGPGRFEDGQRLPLDIAAGAYFGPVLGTLYSALGALGGACAGFLIARWRTRAGPQTCY